MEKQVNIPRKLKVGKNWYSVEIVETLKRRAEMGCVFYALSAIQVAKRSNLDKRAFSPAEMTNTFWHELTHAILHDMNHQLCNNEKFVTEFANRLTQAITTAKFT